MKKPISWPTRGILTLKSINLWKFNIQRNIYSNEASMLRSWHKSGSCPDREIDFDHIKQCKPVPNVILEQYWKLPVMISGNQNIKKRRHHITHKIFPLTTFSNGRSGAGNKQMFNFGLVCDTIFHRFLLLQMLHHRWYFPDIYM